MVFIPPYLTLTDILSYDNLVFDIDGVLLREKIPLPGASEFMNLMVSLGKKVYIVSNNNYYISDQGRDYLQRLGFPRISEDRILTPLRVASDYFKTYNIKNKTFYGLCGDVTKGKLTETFGIQFLDDTPGPSTVESVSSANIMKPDAVLIASKRDHSWFSFSRAISYLQDPKVEYYAMNSDMLMREKDATVLDVGYAIHLIEMITQRKPILFGKPSKAMIDYFKPILKGGKTIMFGDNLETDILFAIGNGWHSAMTLTGVSSTNDIEKLKIQPTYLVDFAKIVMEASPNTY